MARGSCEPWQRILLLPLSFFCACSAWSDPLAPAGEASSSYTLQLPLEDRFLLKRLCTTDGQAVEDPRGQPTLLLGDNPAEASSWAAVLQVRGTYTGESAAPVFEGSREIPVAVLNASNRKAKAIVTWRFHPGGS